MARKALFYLYQQRRERSGDAGGEAPATDAKRQAADRKTACNDRKALQMVYFVWYLWVQTLFFGYPNVCGLTVAVLPWFDRNNCEADGTAAGLSRTPPTRGEAIQKMTKNDIFFVTKSFRQAINLPVR